ncbi:MAG: hypothetical protein LAT82_01365 [Nanoarchaeota archaeon]|nr:hypothetical protein [Nanoarchaeota archaeon]
MDTKNQSKFNLNKFNLIIILMIAQFTFSFSSTLEDSFYITSISKDSDFVPQRIGLVVENSDLILENDKLKISFIFENQKVLEHCNHNLNFLEESSSHRIVYCPIPTQDISGIYEVQIFLIRNGEEILIGNDSFYYNSPKQNIVHDFKNTPQGTLVTIKITDENIEFPFRLFHEIPKEVIDRITKDTINTLISSEQEFKIERENPIISWEVTSREQQIDYVILDKEVSDDVKNDFKSYPYQENTLNFIVVFSILILLLIIFVPLVLRSQKSKNN